MNLSVIVLVVAVMSLAFAFAAGLFAARAHRRFSEVASILHRPRPCYRCAAIATDEYMGLHYCLMCRTVVSSVYPTVRHDPPYGFPGSTGYLEFPKEMEKKDA